MKASSLPLIYRLLISITAGRVFIHTHTPDYYPLLHKSVLSYVQTFLIGIVFSLPSSASYCTCEAQSKAAIGTSFKFHCFPAQRVTTFTAELFRGLLCIQYFNLFLIQTWKNAMVKLSVAT